MIDQLKKYREDIVCGLTKLEEQLQQTQRDIIANRGALQLCEQLLKDAEKPAAPKDGPEET